MNEININNQALKAKKLGQDQQSQEELETIRKCESCLNTYDLEKAREDKPDLGYWADKNYLNRCVSCYHKGNLEPFAGINEIKGHKWYITWKGYQDAAGKSCQLNNCGKTKNLLDLSADDDAKLGGLICKEHFKQYKFKLIGSWARTWEKLFDYEALPEQMKTKTWKIWGKYHQDGHNLTAEEARQSLEDYKEIVNFDQYGNPADRMWHFERWANKHGLSFDEADELLRT